ncbi:MAG: hypothetical protein WC661_06745 [Opitutaceae bacterium]|jgi:hypothetical protein
MKLYRLLTAGLLVWISLMSGCSTGSHPSGADGRAATKILKRWVEASGGARAFKKLESVQSQAAIDFGPLVPDIDMQSWSTVGGRFRIKINTPAFGDLITASDGKTVWQRNEKLGFGLIEPKLGAEMMRDSDPQEELHIDRYYPGRRRLADTSINGQKLQVIEVRTFDDTTEKWFMDPATGLRVRVERAGAVLEFSDFRRTGDFTFAHATKRSGPDGVMTVRIKNMVLNPKIDPAVFAPPARELQDAAVVTGILGRYYEVSGGARLAGIQTRVTHMTMEMPKTGMKSDMKITQKRPHFVLIEQTVPGMGRSVQGYDGKTGWANSEMQGYRVLKGPELQQLLTNADLDAEAKVSAQCPLRTLMDEHVIDGHRTQAVGLASLRGSSGTYYFDKDSGRLVRVESSLIAGPKSVIRATMDISDFRQIDGVSVAFKTVVDNPAMYLVMAVSAVEQNVPVDDAIFKPRQDE